MRQVRLLALMITLVFLLSACGSVEDKAEEISYELLNAEKIVLTADIRADYGDAVYDFKITCSQTPEETAVEIKEPEAVAGIRAVCIDGGFELQYDGVSMTTGVLTRNGLSPAEALPCLIQQWQEGYVTGAIIEKYNDIETVTLNTQITDTVTQRTWFDKETLLPVRSEISQDGIVVIICEFENVIIE